MFANRPGGGGGGDFMEDLKKWWNELGIFTKIFVYGSILLYAASFLSDDLLNWLADFPGRTLLKFEVWRLLTCYWVNFNFLGLLFSFLLFLSSSGRNEKELGTMHYLIDLNLKNIELQLGFCILTFILVTVLNGPFFSISIWPVYLMNRSIFCFSNPERPMGLFFLPVQLPAKFYPFVLFLLITLMGGRIQVDILVSIILGFLHVYFKYPNYQVSKQRLQSLEQSSLLKWFSNLPNFISVNNAGGAPAVGGATQAGGPVGGYGGQNRTPNPITPPAPTTFFSGKGVAIGGGDEESFTGQGTGNNQNKNYAKLNEDPNTQNP
eukprot:TRINITY_DN4692_c0_g1_i5.p1 TRINITY_DN4692_c0_g1~~TRINITY_DN4692_c0_g1_i5.p1  ORF type:complete len:321 (-),score=70.25 TRINITY_DN4692_c0_g1_i5:239-1201(-)